MYIATTFGMMAIGDSNLASSVNCVGASQVHPTMMTYADGIDFTRL